MLGRRSRYGLYWVARGELAEPARTIVEQLHGRVVSRPGAAEFLADLDRRLAAFAAHPTGETPSSVNDEVVLLLRRADQVGLRELLRRERRAYEEVFLSLIDGANNQAPTEDTAARVHDQLLPVLERRLATLLPLALHDTDALAQEMAALASFKSRQPVRSGYTFWPSLIDWSAWWLGTTVGAYLVEQGTFEALPAVFEPRATNRLGTDVEPLVSSYAGDAAQAIGTTVMKRLDGKNYFAPTWEALRHEMPRLALIRERYPELASAADQPLRSLVEFDVALNIALGIADARAFAHWTMYDEQANAFALRLHGDARLRERLAAGLGLRLDEFDEQAPPALEAAHAFGDHPYRDAIRILRTGGRG